MSNDLSADVFVPYSDLLLKHGISFTRVHLSRLMRKGRFPEAYELSPNRIAWKLGELEAWKASRARRSPLPAQAAS